MTIDSLKELQKLIKACRALGVDKIEIDGIKLEFGSLPTTRKAKKVVETTDDFALDGIGINMPVPPPDLIKTDELTAEQLLHWSSSSQEEVN